MKVSEKELCRFAKKNDEVLHYRPWRKRRDGNAWFFGERGGGLAPAYRVFKFSEEQAQLFDNACDTMLRADKLLYLGYALEDRGAMNDFKVEWE